MAVDIMVIIRRLQGSSEIFAEELQLRRGKGLGILREKKPLAVNFVRQNENVRKKGKKVKRLVVDFLYMVSVCHVHWIFSNLPCIMEREGYFPRTCGEN